mgnify:CR=1 FL=1
MTATMNTWWLCIGGDELKTEMTQLEEEGRAIPAAIRKEYERLLGLGHDLMLSENQAKAGAFFDKTIRLALRRADHGAGRHPVPPCPLPVGCGRRRFGCRVLVSLFWPGR